MDNAAIIQTFYEAFAKGDAGTMAACYADNAVFRDPAFGELHGEAVRNMWRMLVARSKGKLQIEFGNIAADGHAGSASWTATYEFAKTGRTVVNKIQASFSFEQGKIVNHCDEFSMWNWSSQALGWKGYILGWTPFMKRKIQKQTRLLLQAYSKA